jgi:hypothetical protein
MQYNFNRNDENVKRENIVEKIIRFSQLSRGDYPKDGVSQLRQEYLLRYPYMITCIPELQSIVERRKMDEINKIVDRLGKPLHTYCVKMDSETDRVITQEYKFDGKDSYFNLYIDDLSKKQNEKDQF